MGVHGEAASLPSLSSELFGVLLEQIPSYNDRQSLLCTCTLVRDAILRAVGQPRGPKLTYDLCTDALHTRHGGQLCMQLWLKEGPLLKRACDTAVRAAGRVQLRIGRLQGDSHTQVATSAQLTQLMAVGAWQQLTVIHLKDILLDQLIPDVLVRGCPNLHTLHLVPICCLLGLGVPTDVFERAYHKTQGVFTVNPAYDLQQHVLNCPSRTILNLLRPTPFPQVRHLTLDVCSVWPSLQRNLMAEDSIRKDLAVRMDMIWQGMEIGPRYITELKLEQLASTNQQRQQQLAAGIKSAQAAWEESHQECIDGIWAVLQGCFDATKDATPEASAIKNAWDAVGPLPAPPLDARGHRTAGPETDRLSHLPQFQFGLKWEPWFLLREAQTREMQAVQLAYHALDAQQERMKAWWDLHSQLVRCHDNAQYAQQLHNALQPQVQQQLAALPNLSSLHILEGADAPPGLAEGVLKLSSQITALKLGTERGLGYQVAGFSTPTTQLSNRCTKGPVMPQQLSSVCSQLTNLQQLQWDAVVNDEGMHHLLKLPHLQHVTLVTNLSQSFADAQCGWRTLMTMHSIPSKETGNSTCKQLAYLPLVSLRQPVRVLRCSDMDVAGNCILPELFALTSDPDADKAVVMQACSNVARCGGVSWVYKPSVHEQDTPCIVFSSISQQQLQVLEASLPLLQGDIMHRVAVQGLPLGAGALSVLAPCLTAWGVCVLDLFASIVSKDGISQFLGHLPPCIQQLTIWFEFGPSILVQFTPRFLREMCAGAVRPITITLKRADDGGYSSSAFLCLKARVEAAHPHVTLMPAQLAP